MTLEEVRAGLRAGRYITTARVETALFLALALEKPLLAEGPAGAGKTELGKVLAAMLETDLVRLQCYEGLDEARALYEWNYQKQLLRIQADRGEGRAWEDVSSHIFSADFLLERADHRALGAGMVIVIDAGACARGLLDRSGHATLELVVVIGVEQVMLAIVLVVDHGLDAPQPFSEDPFVVDPVCLGAIGIGAPGDVGRGQIGATGPYFLVDERLKACAVGARLRFRDKTTLQTRNCKLQNAKGQAACRSLPFAFCSF